MTGIDPWFLYQLKEISEMQLELEKHPMESTPAAVLREAKRTGISDARLADIWRLADGRGASEKIRHLRKKHGIRPVYKHVDTCAAEFESYTPYLYSTYEEEDEAPPTAKKKVIILGSGPNRIGQGIEFDYCCCHAAFALKEDGYEAIMINCNPETVSTDYDTSDRLYFEPLTLEDVLAVYEHEASGGAEIGVIVQFGGQTPLNLALPLKAAGVPIIGTSPESIDLAEDRKRFGKLLDELKIPQPPGAIATSVEEAVVGARSVEFPGLVRPVYVLEVNPRASRTVPYVSKATGVPLAKIAARLMTGRKLREFLPENIEHRSDLGTGNYYYVKSPVFPWNKFPGVDTVLGPEMKSTGEVVGVADNFGEAFAKAQLAAGQKLPTQGTVFLSVTDNDKRQVADLARKYVDMGFMLVCTSGTADVVENAGMNVERVYKVKEGRPNVVDFIKGQRIQLIVNTPTGLEPWFDEKAIRRAAVTARIPTITTLAAARAAAEGIAALQRGEVNVKALQHLHAERTVTRR